MSLQVVQHLSDAMVAGEPLSIAEEDFLGSYLYVARRQGDDSRLSLHDFPACQNFLFKQSYLVYLGNFNGERPVDTPLGRIPNAEVIKDTAFLEKAYQEWLEVIKNERHTEPLLAHVAKESRNQLKNSAKFALKLGYGAKLKASTEKAIVLHSKYFYYKVKKYFQEIGADEWVLNYCGHKLIIDSYAHFHILFRHYAKDTKPYQTDASYHSDQSIDPDILPTELGIIVDDYFDTMPCESFDGQRIYVEINGILYLIWFKSIIWQKPSKKNESVLRLQTFYPVVAQNDLNFVSNLKRTKSHNGRIFFA